MNRTNFPGRKNRRRMDTLEKLVKRVGDGIPTVAQAIELRALERRIVSPIQAHSTYTKKWRATGAPPTGSRASK